LTKAESSGRWYAATAPRHGVTLVLAHGAGAGQDHPFMVRFATGLSARGIDVVTFNFAYLEAGRRAPDPGATLEATYRRVLEAVTSLDELSGGRLVIGGKSMGGRIASQLAARQPSGLSIDRLVFLGYPLHPPGRPAQLRASHLPKIGRPLLFVQGTRDPFGGPDELRPVLAEITPTPLIHAVEGGDHSFAVLKRSGLDQEATYARALDAIERFIVP
jgi:predicted alpha/beta-hydrolase family hydrolase